MVKLKTPFAHLKNNKSLITPYENTRAGFVQMLNVAHQYQQAMDWHSRAAQVDI